MPTRTYVMGDIHGHLHAFDQCLSRSGFDSKKDALIQLGDVSDRYADTAKVVERLLAIPNLIAIRGNHDEWTMGWLMTGTQHPAWLSNGGKETIESYTSASIDRDRHKDFFFNKQQDFYVDEKNRLFTHGGFINLQGPAFDNPPTTCRWDRTLWSEALSTSTNEKWPERLLSFTEIYIGHTPTLNWFTTEPMNAFNVWNLDTGAGTTGKLTIMDVETKEYWQSDDVSELY